MSKHQRMAQTRSEINRIRVLTHELFLPVLEERDAILAEYVSEGYTLAEIASETGYKEKYLSNLLKELGLELKEPDPPGFEPFGVSL